MTRQRGVFVTRGKCHPDRAARWLARISERGEC